MNLDCFQDKSELTGTFFVMGVFLLIISLVIIFEVPEITVCDKITSVYDSALCYTSALEVHIAKMGILGVSIVMFMIAFYLHVMQKLKLPQARKHES